MVEKPPSIKLSGKPVNLADLSSHKRMSLALWGSEGSGKTRFLMTATRPLFLLGFDRPMEPTAWESQGIDCKDVYYYDMGSRPEGVSVIVGDVQRIVREVVSLRQGTLAIDNGKVLWDTVIEALKDPNSRKGALAYGEPNMWMKDVLGTAVGNPAGLPSLLNFIITFPAQDEWVAATNPDTGRESGQRSGRYIPSWWGKTGYFMDSVLWLFRWPTLGGMAVPPTVPAEAQKRVGVTYWARPTKFFHDPTLVGTDISNPSFDKIWFYSYGEHAGDGAWQESS